MVDAQATPQRVHPILRNPDLPTRNPSPALMSPRSQVRFSVPDTNLLDETQMSISESPSKIVFPKSSQDNISENSNDDINDGILSLGKGGHFMDMHSKVMVDVPEEIWNFHTRKRLTKHGRSKSTGSQSLTGSVNDGEGFEMSRSLQAIIADTLDSMGKFKERYRAENSNSQNSSGISQVSLSHLQRETNYDLYLTQYSPLNNYNVPIPLEISLPPYLSPENKDKQRDSLIFDGKSYSPFNGANPYDVSTEEENDDEGNSLNQVSYVSADTAEEASISADSIPSAVHDISFDVNSLNDVDHELGIDEDANVNLKVQRKNLRRQSTSKSSPLAKETQGKSASKNLNDQEVPKLLPGLEPEVENEPPLDQEDIEEENEDVEKREKENEYSSPIPVLNRNPLNILETPSKQIYIPDFDSEPTPATSSAGSLKFFDALEDPKEEPRSNPNREVDNLDMNFKFPPLPPKDDDNDFVKADNSPTDPQFEARRNRLMQQKVFAPGGRRHMHNRSRSMHSAQDMFDAASTAHTSVNTTPNRRPGRSPLRQNHSVHENDASLGVENKSREQPAGETPRHLVEDEYGLPVAAAPSPTFNSQFPVTPSPTGKSRRELAMTPTPFSRRRCGKPITSAPFEEHVNEVELTPESEPYAEHEVELDSSSLYEGVHASKNQPSPQLKEQALNREDPDSPDQSSYNKTEESVRIISEKKLGKDHFDCSDEAEENVASSSTPLKLKKPSSLPVEPVKPLTTIHSFAGPVVPPENEYENIVSMPSDHNKISYNLLSPRRSLSNNGSQSSGNSQFSKQTNQSSRTSYPVEREVINPLVENLKKSDIPVPFSHHLPPVLDDAVKFQRHSMPPFDVYNGSVPSFRQLHEELPPKDNIYGGPYRRQAEIPDGFATPGDYESPESTVRRESEIEKDVHPDKLSRLEFPHYDLRNNRVHNRSRSLQETKYQREYPSYGHDSCKEQYHESQDQLSSQDFMESKRFHVPHKSVQSYMTNDIHGPENYEMLEDYQNINQRFKEGGVVGAPTDVASYAHRLAPSEDFRDVLETLNNMSPTSQISKEPPSKKPDHYVLPETPANTKRTAATDTSNEGYHTEYEERDGRLVEVLVLDDDTNENVPQASTKSSPVSPTKSSRHSSPNKSHDEILRLCEDTASHAKKVILQLVDEKKAKKVHGKKKLSRPPPPFLTKDLPRDPWLAPGHANHRRNSSAISQERYLRNLKRAVKARPHSQY